MDDKLELNRQPLTSEASKLNRFSRWPTRKLGPEEIFLHGALMSVVTDGVRNLVGKI